MATYQPIQYTYGEYDEIAFTSRNDMNLAVWEGRGRVRLYSYGYEDSFKERVGRFLHNGLTQLWDDQQLLDLKVLVGGQVFHCHRVVMASISGLIRSQLTSEPARSRRQSGEPDTIELDDSQVSPEIFQLLLDMIYKSMDILQDDHALDLMKAANYLRIKSLEIRCLDMLVKRLEERSCMKIWDWAENNNIPYLASKAKGVALTYFLVLRHTEDFLIIPLERLTMMLGHELLHYRYEDDILEAILDWVQWDTADRRQHLKELLPYVCFPYLSTRYLNELRKHELIGLRTEFGSYVDEALTYHLAALQKDGKKIQMEVLKRQAHSLKRLMPGMRRVVILIGGAVVQEEPMTTVVACYLDMAHPQSRNREVLQFSIASLSQPLGLRFASTVWKHDVYVSGGSRSPDAFLVYKPHDNMWHSLKAMPEGREDHAMVATDGKLYVLGGRVTSKAGFKIIADISLYDIEADVWRPAGQLPVAVEAAPAVLFSDKVYVFGGRTQSGDSVGVVQMLDLVTGESHVVGMLPQEVEGAKAIVLGKDMILVCPHGAIYAIHVGSNRSRKVTFSEHPEYDDELLTSLDSLPPKADDQREEEEKREDTLAQQSSVKSKAMGGGVKQVDWSLLDAEGTKRVPQLKRTTGDEDSATHSFLQLEDSAEAEQPRSHTSAGEDSMKKISTADAEKAEDDIDDGHNNYEEQEKGGDLREAELSPTKCDGVAAKAELEYEEDFEKVEETDTYLSEQTGSKQMAEESETAVESCEEKRWEDSENKEEEGEEEEEGERKCPNETVSDSARPAGADQTMEVVINKIATMDKRRDFGLFIRKADVMVMGGQSDKGHFLDDILRIHIPTGQVCSTDNKLIIPLSGMQVECTAIHQNYLVQFFDAASCFYGE